MNQSERKDKLMNLWTKSMPNAIRSTITMNLLLALVFFSQILYAQRPIPEHGGKWVHDDATILSSQTISELEAFLKRHRDSTSDQIAILTINSLDGEDIDDYAFKVASAWKLGQADKDNGVLLLVAVQDRLVSIQVGKGLEGVLTDLESSRINRYEIAPRFRQGDYDGGIRAGVSAIVQAVQGEYVNDDPTPKKKKRRGSPMITVLMVLLLIIFLSRRRGGRGGGGYWSSGGGWIPPVIGGVLDRAQARGDRVVGILEEVEVLAGVVQAIPGKSINGMKRILIIFLLLWSGIVTAQRAVPPLWGHRVHDEVPVVSAASVEYLESMLKAHEDSTTNQIAVLIIPSLDGDVLEEYSLRVAHDEWKLGSSNNDNGVLLLIVVNDRKMRIEVGQGLEGVLPDAVTSRIIRNEIAPHFREQKYEEGIRAGVDAIINAIGGEYTGEDVAEPMEIEMSLTERLLTGAFIFVILGLFTGMGLFIKGCAGWFLYAFLIPFYAVFPMAVLNPTWGVGILITYVIAFPIAKAIIARTAWGKKMITAMTKNEGGGSGGWSSGGGWFGGGSSGGGWSSGGGGFSGGGGSFGGGGSSGSW
jgi:uncharacterized protein